MIFADGQASGEYGNRLVIHGDGGGTAKLDGAHAARCRIAIAATLPTC